jgi:MFS family permease
MLDSVNQLAVTLLVLGAAYGMTYTAALTLVSCSPPVGRGSAIGKLEFSFNLGIALMSQLGGISADLFGLWSPYILAGVVALLGSIALLFLYWATRKRHDTTMVYDDEAFQIGN